MLDRETVLFLGAGASEHLKIPIGRGLLFAINEAMDEYADEIHDAIVGIINDEQALDGSIVPRDVSGLMKEFLPALAGSYTPSIDHFLRENPRLEAVGRVAMAATLLDAEDEEEIAMSPNGPAWYEYLWQNHLLDVRDERQTNLRVITLNYDRSFEYFVRSALTNMYAGIEGDEVGDLLRGFGLTHLHGSLGTLDSVPYGATIEHTRSGAALLYRAAEGIVLLTDDCAAEMYASAASVIEAAPQVGFLGFGFHDDVLDRLFPLGRKFGPGDEPANLFGTSLGLTRRKKESTKAFFESRLNGRTVSLFDSDCLGLLKESLLLD